MTVEELAAIEARAAAVAPFVSKHDPVVARKGTITVSNGPFSIYQAFKIAEFYNHAHTDIPALCAEIRRLQEELGDLAFVNGERNETIFKLETQIEQLQEVKAK